MEYAKYVFVIGLVFVSGSNDFPLQTCTPEAKNEKWWIEKHLENVKTTQSQSSSIKIVFIGSSSIDFWRTTGKPIWDKEYAPLGAVNYGITHDRTQNLLWRIENGTLDGLNPKLVVVYIGSNNIPDVTSPEEIVQGVDTVITKIHEKVPNSNILYIGFFPRGDYFPLENTLKKIRAVSDKLKPIFEKDPNRNLRFFDMFWSLAPESMDSINEAFYDEDKLHLNLKGYQLWSEKLNETFYSLLKIE